MNFYPCSKEKKTFYNLINLHMNYSYSYFLPNVLLLSFIF